jgi:hypothetical protein
MCAVSFMVDQWLNPQQPNYVPFHQIDSVTASQMLEVIRRLEEIDKRLNAIDCKLDKPRKDGFKKKLRRRARGVV